MYDSIANQTIHLLHYSIAFVLVYGLIPRLLFDPVEGTFGTKLTANFLRMTLFTIAFGYLLLASKLLEVIGLVFVIVGWKVLIHYKQRRFSDNTALAVVMARFYDFIELPYIAFRNMGRFPTFLRNHVIRGMLVLRTKWLSIVSQLPVVSIMVSSTYLRAYDAIHYPAPALSDGYVAIAWLKYVNERILFHDGIYPQGMYFFMDIITKFAMINPLYIVKYTGPLDAMLIVVGLYYFAKAFTGETLAGITAAGLYGIIGHSMLYSDWSRQAATNSQEFGFVFVLPTLYFLHRYLLNGRRVDYWTAFSGICITGLSHPLAYVLNAVGCSVMLLTHVLAGSSNRRKRILLTVCAGAGSGVVTLAPIGLGLVFGRTFNSSSASFATSVALSNVHPPTLDRLDFLALGALIVIAIKCGIIISNGKKATVWLFLGMFGSVIFSLFYFGGPISKSIVLISRAFDMWAIVEPLVIAAGIAAVFSAIKGIRLRRWLEPISILSVLSIFALNFPTEPIQPYKLQWNEDVQAYLHINRDYHVAGYMLVAPNDEYALVLGQGFRMGILQFVSTYNPGAPPLTRYHAVQTDKNIPGDVFIYFSKHIFEVSRSNSIYPLEAPLYQQERVNRVKLSAWLAKYRQSHDSLEVFYDGPNLIVYHIHENLPPGQMFSN